MIAFVIYESGKLTFRMIILHSIFDYEHLKTLRIYEGTHFGHMMFEACQYATNNDDIPIGLKHVNVKDAQVGL